MTPRGCLLSPCTATGVSPAWGQVVPRAPLPMPTLPFPPLPSCHILPTHTNVPTAPKWLLMFCLLTTRRVRAGRSPPSLHFICLKPKCVPKSKYLGTFPGSGDHSGHTWTPPCSVLNPHLAFIKQPVFPSNIAQPKSEWIPLLTALFGWYWWGKGSTHHPSLQPARRRTQRCYLHPR